MHDDISTEKDKMKETLELQYNMDEVAKALLLATFEESMDYKGRDVRIRIDSDGVNEPVISLTLISELELFEDELPAD